MTQQQNAGGQRGGGRAAFKGGMTIPQAREICAQVHNWALLALSLEEDAKRIPHVPSIPLKRLVYALDVLAKAKQPAGISESTICALVCLRTMRSGVSVRTRRADGQVVTLTLNAGPTR